MYEDNFDENSAPYERLIQTESKKIVYSFCTLCALLENKRLTLGNIFKILNDDKAYQTLYKSMLTENDLIDALRTYLLTFPEILSNKSVKIILQTWR